jgi:hypothetical protein
LSVLERERQTNEEMGGRDVSVSSMLVGEVREAMEAAFDRLGRRGEVEEVGGEVAEGVEEESGKGVVDGKGEGVGRGACGSVFAPGVG